jgi:hypothetical protein
MKLCEDFTSLFLFVDKSGEGTWGGGEITAPCKKGYHNTGLQKQQLRLLRKFMFIVRCLECASKKSEILTSYNVC